MKKKLPSCISFGFSMLLIIFITSCEKSTVEKNEIAIIACNIIQSDGISAPDRIKEVNSARKSIGQQSFLLSDEVILEAIELELCNDMILNTDRDLMNKLVLEKEQREKDKFEIITSKLNSLFKEFWEDTSCKEFQENWSSDPEFADTDFASFMGLNLSKEELDEYTETEQEYIKNLKFLEEESSFQRVFKNDLEHLNLIANNCKVNEDVKKNIEKFHNFKMVLLYEHFKNR